jgi:hypothetical protein
MRDSYGGSVWESNPPSFPRRDGSPALKAGRITGPHAPPCVRNRMIALVLTCNRDWCDYCARLLGVSSGVSWNYN